MDITSFLMGSTLAAEITTIPAVITAITITASDWEAYSALPGYTCYQDVAVSNVAAGYSTYTSVSPASLEIARSAGMASASTAMPGRIRYFAMDVPSEDISAQVLILQTRDDHMPGYGTVNTTGDIGVMASMNKAFKASSIAEFDAVLLNYGLTLQDYGKIRAAMFYQWSDSAELTAAEIAEIFSGEDPAQMETGNLESAVLNYANLSLSDWFAIYKADGVYRITARYLPDRQSIQNWTG